MSEPKHRWQVWRGSELSGSSNVRDSFRWRWHARLVAWCRTRAGWATYFVRDRDAVDVFDLLADLKGLSAEGIRALDPPSVRDRAPVG